MKKLLAIVISMAMIVAMMPVGVFADGGTSEEGSSGETPVTEKVAKIGDEQYETLEAAVEAAASNQTIELLGDLSNIGKINLPAGVTLDGNNKKISGNSAINVNAAGGTIKNISFEIIHNETAVSEEKCNQYGWESKRGDLSAIYASQLTGKLEVSGCTFDNVDWDAIQIAPEQTASVIIKDNVFEHTNKDTSQLRYIHIESNNTSFYGQKISELTVTDNQFYKSANTYRICAIGIYRVSKDSTNIKLDGNYFEDRDAVNLDKIDALKLYPMRSNPEIDNDDILPMAKIRKGVKVTYFDTLSEAVVKAKKGEIISLLKDCNENITIDNEKDLVFAPKEYKLSGKIINNGILQFTSYGTNKNGDATIENNGTLIFGCNAATGYTVKNNNVLRIINGGNYDLNKIENRGKIFISGGTFTTKPDNSILDEWYIAITQNDSTFKVRKMNNMEAVGNGAVAAVSSNIDISNDYYKTVAEAINNNKKNTVHLLCNVDNENVVNAGGIAKFLSTHDYSFTGSIIMAKDTPLTIKGKGTTVLTNIESNKLILGSPNEEANVCIKVANLEVLDIMASGKCKIEGGNFKEIILKSYYEKDGEKPLHTGELQITGGVFNSDKIKLQYTNHNLENGNDYELVPIVTYVADGYTVTESNGKFIVSRISTGGGAVVPPATDNVTNNTTDKNTTADLTPAVKDNKAETTVDAKTADKIVNKAVANKSTEVIVDAAGNNTVASSEVAIPEKTVKELAEKTDAKLVIKTDNGKVDLDKTAVKALADQAGTTGTVKLIVETVKNDADICHVNLKLVTSNGAVTDFRGGNVKVTINLTKELAAKELVCVYIDDNGIYTLVEGVLNADGTYTFTTGHFSEYAVMAKEEADKKIAEQLDTMIKDVNLKVRTSKLWYQEI